MAIEEVPKKTPHDTLIAALEHVEDMEDVLVIYGGKEHNKCGSFDSDLTIAESLYLLELFRHWMMDHALGDGD